MKWMAFPEEIIPVCIHVLIGIELMCTIRKARMVVAEAEELTFAEPFYALAR